ncbi:MAG: glycosyltransferase [Bacteroidales bacterium]|nr:glycosyltransferase [Bacteroidales bacterium]
MTNSNNLKISVIVPVFNRPAEVEELLESMDQQTFRDFEVLIVEDGSSVKSESIIREFADKLNIRYFYKDNSGPGQSRNYGYERASGNYCIFLDSDCLLPPRYFETVYNALSGKYVDAFGGPDRAHENFTHLQKAINYSMTSFFTTGGIRGGGEKLDKFFPRSFNMGYSREVFEATRGFAKMRFGEDIDMSIRILKNGFKTRLIREAWVYHKRRTNFRQFYKQVFNSGIARINLYKKYPESLKTVHFAPALFTAGSMLLILFSVLLSPLFLLPFGFHILLLFLDATIKNKSISIGFLSIVTSYIQLFSYGMGFIKASWKRVILGKDEFSAFNKNFYK